MTNPWPSIQKHIAFAFLLFLFLNPHTISAQSHKVGGMISIDVLNSPGVGGINIKLKGTDIETVSDNDGEYRIMVPNNESVLIFSYLGMISQEATVGNKTRIDIDLLKLPKEAKKTIYATKIGIVLDKKANYVEKNVAEVLKNRLQKNSKVTVSITNNLDLKADINIFLGKISSSERLNKLSKKYHATLPGIDKPFAEGYAVKMITQEKAPIIVALGADNRGVLYAAGEILRQMEAKPLAISFSTFDVSSSPAYRFRGTNAPQGGSMRRVTKVRAWTKDEANEAILDYALAGANCFYAEIWNGDSERYRFIKSFDLMTIAGIRPNQFDGELPENWKAGGLADWEWHGNNWVCPSIPKAREALLAQWTERLKTLGNHDILRFYGGDPGGCRDERCMPWGKTFVKLCEDISKIALKTHPDLKIIIANQDICTEGDMAIFDYLSEKPQEWLYAMGYGPGSNAMSWYFRHKLNDELFEYQGYGWLNRYLAETLNSIPKNQKIVHYSDVTHWIMAQYNIENPERNLVRSYGRRTWHTRPTDLHQIFQAIMPFSQGDITYSEGYHDQFNQYFWQRLLWNPHMTAKDVVNEYCNLYFGKKASGLMTKAIFQMEENLIAPLATNNGIDRYYVFVKEAGSLIPENIMKKDHVWRLYMQKAALDKYNQLKLQHELFQEERIRKLLQASLESGKLKNTIEQSLIILDEPKETPVMVAYREEANKLGIETEELFAYRNVGYFKLNQHLRDIEGLSDILKKIRNTKSQKTQQELIVEAIKITQKKTNYGNFRW